VANFRINLLKNGNMDKYRLIDFIVSVGIYSITTKAKTLPGPFQKNHNKSKL